MGVPFTNQPGAYPPPLDGLIVQALFARKVCRHLGVALAQSSQTPHIYEQHVAFNRRRE